MRRFAASLVLVLVAFGAAAATSKDDVRRSYVVRLYDDPGMQKIVDIFRPNGYRVDVIHETKPSNTVAQYTVIEVGSDIPASEAIEVPEVAKYLPPAASKEDEGPLAMSAERAEKR